MLTFAQQKELCMDLKTLSDQTLLDHTDRLVKQERELLVEILHHLREIDRRRLYSALKYRSLFDYAVRRLGYSQDQADRRISAMRLMKELPELEEKVGSGALTLTNLGIMRSLFKKQQYSKEKKLELLQSIENKSVRDTARVVATVSPEALRPDRIRPVTETKDEVKFTADPSLREKLEKLKGLLAHSNPGIGLGELVEKLADLGLQEWAKTAVPRDSSRQQPESEAGIRRAVFRRDQNCTNCGSTFAMEQDHRHPKALGGATTKENLRVLCRNCNQRAAIEVYGIPKMEKYLKSPHALYRRSIDFAAPKIDKVAP
jgi:HNH endonuclease